MFLCTSMEDRRLSVTLAARMSGTSIARVNCLRRDVFDLLVVDPGKAAHIVTYGLRQMPIQLSRPQTSLMVVDNRPHDIAQLVEDIQYTVIIVFGDGSRWRANFDLDFGDDITVACLRTLSMTLPGDCFYSLQLRYLQRWQREGRTIAFGRSFECFRLALSEVFRFPIRSNCGVDPNDPWSSLGRSASQNRFIDDPALDHLHLPPNLRSSAPAKATETPHELLCPTLNSLHLLAEDFRQTLSTEERVFTLAPLLFDMASVIRPEWADYWKRVIPDVIDAWPSPLDIGVLLSFFTGKG
jgi:anaphase-promoting complex subunit 1